MSAKQPSLFDGMRLTLNEALDISLDSLRAYGARYRHWAIAFSGGKDSSATAAFVTWAIKTGKVERPESLTILYADTRQELPPLQRTAMQFMDALRADGFDARVVLPDLDDRFYVYMFGRGVPPPKNRFRWCTPQLKVEPMQAALAAKRAEAGEKFLMLTGVRLGESAVRDARIAVSCSKDSGECGQGWFQTMPSESVSDVLAPLLHWRLCHVWDWLAFGPHGYKLSDVALVYGDGDVRTGCIGCNLASRDTALENLIKQPNWAHLTPLMELKPLFAELTKPKWRKRKATPDTKKDGTYAKNGQRMGPLTMAGRAYGLARVLDIQARAGVDLINAEEEARIRALWAANTWPDGWDGHEVNADVPIDQIAVVDNELVVQPLLV
jgi:DNA sulfur modification protein DndC